MVLEKSKMDNDIDNMSYIEGEGKEETYLVRAYRRQNAHNIFNHDYKDHLLNKYM